MSHILICATPGLGHSNPMITIGKHLVEKGHQVTFHSAEANRRRAESAGLRFIPFLGKANFDPLRVDEAFPGMKDAGTGIARLNYECIEYFAEMIPDQSRGVQQIMADASAAGSPIDLILTETGFWGIYPLVLGPREKRPPVVTCGIFPLFLSSADFSAFSLPDTTPEGRKRNREANQQFVELLQPITDHTNRVLAALGAPPLTIPPLDCMILLTDRYLQLTAEAFEFPRSDKPDMVEFVGAVLPTPPPFEPPAWWRDLDGSQPVILVTQGTIANVDMNELIQPTLSALAKDDVLVIATTGRPDGGSLTVPGNARVLPFLPYDQILPKVDVFVSNGGYSSVNYAFSEGIPIVLAGTTEDKAFTAARVAWSGAGINIGTAHPTQAQIREAVHKVLTDKTYRTQARRLQASFAQYHALDRIASVIESAIGKISSVNA